MRIEEIRAKAEAVYRNEYYKALTNLSRNLSPRERNKIARRIAWRKYCRFLEDHGLTPSDLVERPDCKLEDLL